MKIASNYAFLFLNKENKTLLGPPPPPEKAQRYGYMDNSYEYIQCTGGLLGIAQCVYSQLHAQVFVYTSKQSMTWYSLGRDLSDSVLYNYAGTKVSPLSLIIFK